MSIILCIIPDDTQYDISAIPFLKRLLEQVGEETVSMVHYVRVSMVKDVIVTRYDSVIACGVPSHSFPRAKQTTSPMSSKPGDFILCVLTEVLTLMGETDPHLKAHEVLVRYMIKAFEQWRAHFHYTKIDEIDP